MQSEQKGDQMIILEIEQNMRRKEIENLFKNVFLQAQELLRRQVPENQFAKKLDDLMELCSAQIIKLSDHNDSFIKTFRTFAETYKSGLQEFKDLLLIMKQIELQKGQLKNVKICSFQQHHGALLSEIKFSEKRLQRMRAGVKLAQVLEESLTKKYKEVKEANLEQIIPIEQNATVDQSDIDFVREIDEGFQQQKQRVNQMIKSSYKFDKNELDFSQKYQKPYFQKYFKERYKLANYFLGDEQIKKFLRENQEYMKKKYKENSNVSQQATLIEKNFIKDLDAKNFITQDDLEGNGKALQKILKINKEIKEELLQEDHQRNLQEINQFEIQQKQTYWEKVLSQDEQGGMRKTTPSLRRQQTQSRLVEKRIIPIKKVSSLQKRTIFYQAHPNFPLIKETFNQDIHIPEERLKKNAIGYEIENKPDKILQAEDDIYPQQARLRTPKTTTMSVRGGFFPSQPGFNRSAYQEFKSLTSLWGEKWSNY